MYIVQAFLEHYGILVLFLLGFAEFLGLPLAGGPILMLIGGVARTTNAIHPVLAVIAASSGGLVADLAWFGAARWQGRRMVGFACGLASNPGVCVERFSQRIALRGAPALLFAKFVPGSGAVPAIASGIARLPTRRFIWVDGAALVVWASVYLAAGWLLGERVEDAVTWAERRSAFVVGALLLAAAGAVTWRLVKQRLHRRMHGGTEVAGADQKPSGGSV